MQKLKRLTEHVWYMPYEEARDRPNLGYIGGLSWSIAVDAGHSNAHVRDFYDALKQEHLPLPTTTILTHWHWDHSFGLHATHGISLANAKTQAHLCDFMEKLSPAFEQEFRSWHPSIAREFAHGRKIQVIPIDLIFSKRMQLLPGGITVEVFEAPSPHTDDATLVYVPEEKVLFLGDATCGVFPSWERDPKQAKALAATIQDLDVDVCLEGHCAPESKSEVLKNLLDE